MEKDISCKWKWKKAGIALCITDKIDFKMQATVRDKEGHYIMIKGAIQQEAIILVSIYAPNYIKQILMDRKGELNINSKTIIVGDFNTPLTSMYTSSRQKTNKKEKP